MTMEIEYVGGIVLGVIPTSWTIRNVAIESLMACESCGAGVPLAYE